MVAFLAIFIGQVVGRAASEAHIRFPGFTGTVHQATNDGQIHRLIDVFQACFQLVDGLDHVEVLPGTAGAGDDVHALLAKVQAFQDIKADPHFFHWIGGQGNTNGVANAFHQQRPQGNGGFHRARAESTRFGDAQVQGLLQLGRKLAISLQGHEDIGGLHAHLEVLKIVAIQNLRMAHGGFHQRIGSGLTVFTLQLLFQGAGVDTDTNGNAFVLGALDHCLDTVFTTDVAWIDTQTIHAPLCHSQGNLVIVMDIRNQRHIHLLAYLSEGLGGIHTRHRHPHDIHTCILQAADLANRGIHVTGFGVSHALYGDGGIAAHRDVADKDLTGLAALDFDFRFHGVSTLANQGMETRTTVPGEFVGKVTASPLRINSSTAPASPRVRLNGALPSSCSEAPAGCSP